MALLLWGMRMVQTGIQRALGGRLRNTLGAALRNRTKAFFAGLAVTAVLQSSTATGLMISGFVGEGLVDLPPALAVMLGANIGTTLIVQLLSFDASLVAPALILAGVVMFQRTSAAYRDFGRVFIGLGLMLLALHQFAELLQPLVAAPLARAILAQLSNHLALSVMVGLLLAWMAHSSVATVLLAMSLTSQGEIPPSAALAIVLGANLGAAINPVLEGAAGPGGAGRRVALGNLFNRLVGVAVALALIPQAVRLISILEPSSARVVADFHTAFNTLMAAALFPWLKTYARWLERVIRTRIDTADPSVPLYLEPLAREAPVIALGGAAREALRMADVLEGMLRGLRAAFRNADRRDIGEIRRTDDVLDRLNRSIKVYVTAIDPAACSDIDHRRAAQILAFATGLEQAGDVIDRGLLRVVAKQRKRDLTLPADSQVDILKMIDRIVANLHAAAALFAGGDKRAARLLVREKEAFRRIGSAATAAHFERLREGHIATAETSALYLDTVRDLKRINADVIEAAAYPLLEAAGDLLPSRLREELG